MNQTLSGAVELNYFLTTSEAELQERPWTWPWPKEAPNDLHDEE